MCICFSFGSPFDCGDVVNNLGHNPGVWTRSHLEEELYNSAPPTATVAMPAAAAAASASARAAAPWRVPASATARRTVNPIRALVDGLALEPNPDKPVIALSIGDPTIFGNFGPPPEAVAAVRDSLDSGRYNGYAPCAGYKEAREAVANYVSYPNAEVEFKDVVLCSGCSSALEMCITALCDPGQNLLVPRPGFALYRTLAESIGVHIRSYNLMPERGWEADLRHLEQQADARTAALLINNPSNPCGSVWRPQHLRDLLQLARRLRLPVIADEIYEHLVFPGERFVPMASLTSEVPILSCGGLTKRFMVPGWRMGWIVIHDPIGAFSDEIRKALNMLSQRTIGSNTIVQGALPAILENKHKTFFENTSRTLQEHAALVFGLLSRIEGLRPVMPQGAMYMMVGLRLQDFPAIACELSFVERLMAEESVFLLPGQCFDFPGYVRLVLTAPPEQLREACERIAAFCLRHRQPQPATASAAAAADHVGLPFVQEPRAAAAGGYGNP